MRFENFANSQQSEMMLVFFDPLPTFCVGPDEGKVQFWQKTRSLVDYSYHNLLRYQDTRILIENLMFDISLCSRYEHNRRRRTKKKMYLNI